MVFIGAFKTKLFLIDLKVLFSSLPNLKSIIYLKDLYEFLFLIKILNYFFFLKVLRRVNKVAKSFKPQTIIFKYLTKTPYNQSIVGSIIALIGRWYFCTLFLF